MIKEYISFTMTALYLENKSPTFTKAYWQECTEALQEEPDESLTDTSDTKFDGSGWEPVVPHDHWHMSEVWVCWNFYIFIGLYLTICYILNSPTSEILTHFYTGSYSDYFVHVEHMAWSQSLRRRLMKMGMSEL